MTTPRSRLAAGFVVLAAIIWTATSPAALGKSVVGRSGMISAGHPAAVMAGLNVLNAGGNACDAAIAASAALSVTMVDMMGPLGSGYAVIWDAGAKRVDAIDFNGVAPARTDPTLYTMEKKRRGILAPTVPGALKGWEAIHKKCGTKPWAELWRDAIDLAGNGRPVDPESAAIMKRFQPELQAFPTWTREFTVGGETLPEGYLHKRPELAKTYREFAARGAAALYGGSVGDQLVAFMDRNGGLITKDDLARYDVRWSKPIESTYRGLQIYGAPPSSSSITWMETLNFVEGFDMKALGHNSANYLRVFVEATKHAYLDGYRYNGDPAFVNVPVDRLLSKPYASEVQRKIKDITRWEMKPATAARAVAPQTTATSHMSIVDRWGNAVALTNTLGNLFGAGLVVDGTGLLLSNGMDWFDIDQNIWTGERPGALGMAPGKRNRWTLSPGIVMKDGKPFIIVGGAGAETTMWGIAQPLVNIIDFGMDAQTALDAPRFGWGDMAHYGGGTEVNLHAGIGDDVRAQFKAWGYEVPEAGKARAASRGATNLIVIDPKSGV
ncbi:MAG: gamma-glutamyltransferase, partial [Vicinamibacterales bacterium]